MSSVFLRLILSCVPLFIRTKSAGLLLHVAMGVREQQKIIRSFQVLQRRTEGPSETSELIVCGE